MSLPRPQTSHADVVFYFIFFLLLFGQEESVLEEAAVLRRLTHSSVVRLLRFETLPSYHYLVLEVCFACFGNPVFGLGIPVGASLGFATEDNVEASASPQ